MKILSKLPAAIVILTWSFAIVANTPATVLIFNNAAGNLVTNQGSSIPQAYGDNVTSTVQGAFSYGIGAEGPTPNIVADWGTAAGFSSDPIAYSIGFGDLINVAYGQFPGIRLRLTGPGSNTVALYSFDLGAFGSPGTIRSNMITTISNESGPIYSNLNTIVAGFPTHSTFDFSSSPLVGQFIDIHVNLNAGGHNGLVAIDNIVFAQIPEPSTLLLLLLGGAALMGWRRRR